MDTDKVLLWDSPNAMRNRDANQLVFRKMQWCITHDFPDTFGGPLVMCWRAKSPFNECEFVEKLVEV